MGRRGRGTSHTRFHSQARRPACRSPRHRGGRCLACGAFAPMRCCWFSVCFFGLEPVYDLLAVGHTALKTVSESRLRLTRFSAAPEGASGASHAHLQLVNSASSTVFALSGHGPKDRKQVLRSCGWRDGESTLASNIFPKSGRRRTFRAPCKAPIRSSSTR